MNRYLHSFLASLFIYITFILLIIFSLKNIKQYKTNSENIVKMAILNPQEESAQKQVAKIEHKEEKVHEKPKNEPMQKKETIKPSIVSKAVPIKQAEVAKKETEKIDSKQPILQKSYVGTQTEKDKFTSDIKNKIQQNKYYPEVARNREQEGIVKVSFFVNSDGSVSNIVCSGEYSALNSAAKNAVAKTFPVKVPPNLTFSRLELSVTLSYKLNRLD